MISEQMHTKLNNQIRNEFEAAYFYLAAATWCDLENWSGAAKFFRLQAQEEVGHGMKILDYLLSRNSRVELQALGQPTVNVKKLVDVFAQSLENEKKVTASIQELLNLAHKEGDYASVALLNWFATEQTEEEDVMDGYVSRLNLVGDDGTGLLLIDNELGARQPEAE